MVGHRCEASMVNDKLTAAHRSFWKDALKESKTGNFSFWQGKIHIVGVSGASARKLVLEHPNLDFVAAQSLLAFGMHFWPPIHQIFHQMGDRARNNTHFLQTLLPLMKTQRLERALPDLVKDARKDFKALLRNNPSGVINSPDLWRTVFKQSTRLFFADDFAEDPALFNKTADYLEVILHSYSPFYAFHHWILEPSMIRRRLARWGLRSTAEKLYNKRLKSQPANKDDPLQLMIDNGDSKEFITEFCASGTFITTTNAHIIFPQMIETMAVHENWQEKCYQEIVAVADKYSKDKSAPLIDQLNNVPLKAWETSFPNFELCLYEIIRVWTSFAVGRLNVTDQPIAIPGSDEVIPGGAYAVWNSTELNFDPKMFPEPRKFDPLRFTEGRREFEKEPHGCKSFPERSLVCLTLNADPLCCSLWLGRRHAPLCGQALGQAPAAYSYCPRTGCVQMDKLRCQRQARPVCCTEAGPGRGVGFGGKVCLAQSLL